MPPSSVSVSTSTEGTGMVGGDYSIICTVSKPAGLLADPDIVFITPSGTEIESGQVINITQTENMTSVSVTITLSPLLASHSGGYTCNVSLSSPSLVAPMNFTSVVTVSVTSKTC